MANYYLDKSQFGYSGKFSMSNALPVDLSIKEFISIDHQPITPIKRGSTIEFALQPMASFYVDLSKTRLKLHVRLIDTETGAAISDADVVGLANAPIHTLFRSIDFSINQKELNSATGTNHPYRGIFDVLLRHSKGQHDSMLQAAGVFLDSAGAIDSTTPANNSGLLKRSLITAKGNIGQLVGNLVFDGSDIKQFLPNGLALNFKLHPSRDAFSLMSEEARFSVEITDAVLQMTYVQPSSELLLAHDERFQRQPALFSYNRHVLRSYVIPGGLSTWSIDNIFSGECPSEIVIGFVGSTAYTGDFERSPFNFENFGLAYLEFAVEGHQNRSAVFKPDFVTRKFCNEFLSLFHERNNYEGVIDIENYALGYALYRIKLDDGIAETYRSMNLRAQTRLSVRFNSPLAEAVTLVTEGRFGATLQIDKSRNVYTV